ncbi:sensor histidine kinase [Pseudobutyrivibrio ruminis]|uniref:Sensor histidine kinase NatK-like C-terminal domain-containing protein n=1 Tax=Pseudobutyrivibrio ruminis TaxID=46206 RepID=A0A2G3DWT7_9FIRM|nr:ATP-binding protein [Pseudobutyrivibrio ruminis]PHU35411.1 hypothetical protein CSX01_05445 [Pseudobutyrivibrio ruminis]
MLQIINALILLFWWLLEIINVHIIVKFFLDLPTKKSRRIEILAKWFIFLVIVIGYTYVVLAGYKQIQIKFVFTVLIFLKTGLLMSTYYKINIRNYMLIAFFVELVSFVGYNVLLLIKKVFDLTVNYTHTNEIIGEILLFLALITLAILKCNKLISIWIADMKALDYLLFILVLFTLSVIEANVIKSDGYSRAFNTTLIITVISIVIVIIRMIIVTEKKNSLEDINNILERHMKQTTDYYNELIKKDNQSRKFRHDIKNLLLGLHAMIKEGENEKATRYIEELQDVCSQLKPKYDTGNFMADAILSAKDNRAAHYNSEIEVDGFIPSERVSDVDMVVVLSNMLDNAIEACMKIEGKKIIKINSILNKKIWILNIENPSNEVAIVNNMIHTTKSDESLHGFGLKNIERIVKKYNGDISLKYNDGYFCSKITFILDNLQGGQHD